MLLFKPLEYYELGGLKMKSNVKFIIKNEEKFENLTEDEIKRIVNERFYDAVMDIENIFRDE